MPLSFDPEHLFQEAVRLTGPFASENEPRQTDLRRAISAAYYGLFHFTLTAATGLFFAARPSDEYAMAYRSVRHEWLRALCEQLQRKQLAKTPPHIPETFFGDVVKFATTFAELQELRHRADYDPSFSIKAEEVKIRIAEARRAVELFSGAEEKQRAVFLALLLFDIRQTVRAPRSSP